MSGPCLLADQRLIEATTAGPIAAARRLFEAYADWLQVDLCFQGFAEELAKLPGPYAPPAGRLLLAEVAGEVVGCVALRPFGPEPGICEMKRLWVEPGFGGRGLGRQLATQVIEEARAIGYRAMRLDTFPERMPAAQHLYETFGFRPIPAYYDNPHDGVVMLELALSRLR